MLTLVYTVTLTDSQGATSQQTITVTITGTDAPAVVWIATDKAGAPSGGFWKDASELGDRRSRRSMTMSSSSPISCTA